MENLFESQDIVDIKIEDSIKASYLDYSMSVIIGLILKLKTQLRLHT